MVPTEAQRWNWGAFLLNWIWGLAHNTPLALLVFVPCAGWAMPFVLGARGGAWAWQNRRWESIEQFQKTQRQWALAALALLCGIATFAVALFFVIEFALKQSDVYQEAYATLNRDSRATSILGTPIDTGMVGGSISTSGTGGSADISFSVRGPKAKGKLYTQAEKDLGRWHIERMELEIDGSPTRLRLIERTAPAPTTAP